MCTHTPNVSPGGLQSAVNLLICVSQSKSSPRCEDPTLNKHSCHHLFPRRRSVGRGSVVHLGLSGTCPSKRRRRAPLCVLNVFFPHLLAPIAAAELSSYSVTTLAVVIVAPVIILIVLSAVAILVFRRIHNNQMERLTLRDAEYGTIDGLIASNVGESTLAVSGIPRLRTKNSVGAAQGLFSLTSLVFYFNLLLSLCARCRVVCR